MATSSTTYVPKWNASPTKLIRVPESLADEILAYAHFLDERTSDAHDVRDPSPGWGTSSIDLKRPVNVASVPMRSPFRYPGGKTWMVPYLRAWLRSVNPRPGLFVEPFAGGGVCSLTAAFENLTDHVVMGELDANVAAVWKTILHGQAEWLAGRILNYQLSVANIRADLSDSKDENISTRERAFLTILRNRVQRGGIMASGAGLVKGGENGKGISSRWYPETLARRIREIACVRDRISFVEGDGFVLIEQHLRDDDCMFLLDPPYTVAARRLYTHWEFDHERLFELMTRCRGDFLITYDNTPEIRRIARDFGLACMPITTAERLREASTVGTNKLLVGKKHASWLKASI